MNSRTRTSAPATKARSLLSLLLVLLLSCSLLAGCAGETAANAPQTASGTEQDAGAHGSQPDAAAEPTDDSAAAPAPASTDAFDLAQVPDYSGSPYAIVADDVPALREADAANVAESYAPLDSLGRCGVAIAVVSPATMPTEERGSIGMVKPSGWHTVRYDDLVDGKYLYNRCHLLGYQLTGENANVQNLITGTRYLNTEGMLPFENEIADYVERTGGSILMRVTPVFVGDELVARGVHMEALSLGDAGAGVRFNVFCYNVQPGIGIDYATGDSWRAEQVADTADASNETGASDADVRDYVLNTSSKKFHLPSCSSVGQIAQHNKQEFTGTRDELIAQGYEPCERCNP